MIGNQYCRTMLLMIGMLFMTTIMSNYNVEAYYLDQAERDSESMTYLRQLLYDSRRNDNKDLSFGTRVEAEGDCTLNLLKGYRWHGKQSMSVKGIDTTQRCMGDCDINKDCVGWSYNPQSKLCAGFSSITGVIKSSQDTSGSCIGKSIKTQCADKRKGQYSGHTIKILSSIGTVEDCMSHCDQLTTCYAWTYSENDEKCTLSDQIYKVVNDDDDDDGIVSGTCFASQKRIRVPDPLREFRKQALESHNTKRKEHNAPALTLDDQLNKEAQDYANKLAKEDVMPPAGGPSGMASIFYDQGDASRSCENIVDCFYDERKYYNCANPDFGLTSHFPKIIWKGSRKLGVGRAFSTDTQTMYVVLSYDWKGNMVSSYKQNVEYKCDK